VAALGAACGRPRNRTARRRPSSRSTCGRPTRPLFACRDSPLPAGACRSGATARKCIPGRTRRSASRSNRMKGRRRISSLVMRREVTGLTRRSPPAPPVSRWRRDRGRIGRSCSSSVGSARSPACRPADVAGRLQPELDAAQRARRASIYTPLQSGC